MLALLLIPQHVLVCICNKIKRRSECTDMLSCILYMFVVIKKKLFQAHCLAEGATCRQALNLLQKFSCPAIIRGAPLRLFSQLWHFFSFSWPFFSKGKCYVGYFKAYRCLALEI